MKNLVKYRSIILTLSLVVVASCLVSLLGQGWVVVRFQTQTLLIPKHGIDTLAMEVGLGLWGVEVCTDRYGASICVNIPYSVIMKNQTGGPDPDVPILEVLGLKFKDASVFIVLLRCFCLVGILFVTMGTVMTLLYLCHRRISDGKRRCYYIGSALMWILSGTCFVLATGIECISMIKLSQMKSLLKENMGKSVRVLPYLSEPKVSVDLGFPWVIVVNVLEILLSYLLALCICVMYRRGGLEKDYIKYVRVNNTVDSREDIRTCQIAFNGEGY